VLTEEEYAVSKAKLLGRSFGPRLEYLDQELRMKTGDRQNRQNRR
jgi:hypothetical protein